MIRPKTCLLRAVLGQIILKNGGLHRPPVLSDERHLHHKLTLRFLHDKFLAMQGILVAQVGKPHAVLRPHIRPQLQVVGHFSYAILLIKKL